MNAVFFNMCALFIIGVVMLAIVYSVNKFING